MARQVFAVAGAVVGAWVGTMVGNPALGAQWGYAIGSLIGNAVDPVELQGRKLGDAPAQTAAEGGARAIVFGKGCIRATCVLERGGRRVIKQRQSQGKGSGPTTVNERALWTFAIGLGEDLIDGQILRIWENERLVYDITPDSPIPGDSIKFGSRFRFYDGAETQLPDPAIEAIHPGEDAPYYRGTAYMVFPQYDLTDFGETVPTYRVEVARAVELTGYYWDAANTGDGGIIEEGGRLFRSNTPTSQRPMTRTVNPMQETEKVYWEVRLVSVPEYVSGDPIMSIGIVNGLHPVSGQQYVGRSNGSDGARGVGLLQGKTIAQNVTFWSCGDAVGGAIYGSDYAEGDVLMVAWDGINKNLYLGKNGIWDHSQTNNGCVSVIANPVSNIYPTSRIADWIYPWQNTGPFYLAVTGRDYGGESTLIELSAVESEFVYPIPVGYRAGGASISANGDPVPLETILSSIHGRVGQGNSDIDVSEATDVVSGLVIEQTVTAGEAINSIIGPFFMDTVDVDGKIRYIKRGKEPLKTLTEDDLVDEPDSARRNNAIEYPRKLHFFYSSPATAYATAKATSARYSAQAMVVGEGSVACPVTFDDPLEPHEIAAKLHKILWAEAEGEIVWHVTDEHLDVVPSDVLTLSYMGRVTRARVVQVESDWAQMKLRMKVDRLAAYTSDITDVVIPPAPTPPQPSSPSDTVLAILDIPALTDDADDLHLLAAMSGEDDAWAGATLQQSLDDGASFISVGSTNINAIMGTLLEDVPAADPRYMDRTNHVRVQLYTDDQLEDRSLTMLLRQGGAFALSYEESGGTRWELMQFQDAEEVSPKEYRLTTLIRGRKATDGAFHAAGAMFVYLDPSLVRQAAQSAWIGDELIHRAISNGLTPESADLVTTDYEGNSQREWPVGRLILDSAASIISATAIPRHRFGTSDRPVRSINWTGYRWRVTDGSSVITRDGTSPTETFNVSGWSSPVSVTVSQLNRITGPGPSVTEEIEA